MGLSIDGTSNIKERGAGVVLDRYYSIRIDQALKFEFTTINNQEEYEALIASMALALKMGASRLKSKSGSQLVANQVSG